MANEKISQLASGSPAEASDLIPIARGGANYSLKVSDIARQTEAARIQYTVTSTDVDNGYFIAPVTWDTAFPDTDYTIAISIAYISGSGFYSKLEIQNKTAAGLNFAVVGAETVTVAAVVYTVTGTMFSNGDVWELNAMAIHD